MFRFTTCSFSIYIRRMNNQISYRQFEKIDKTLPKESFFVGNTYSFLEFFEKKFCWLFFSLSGLRREIHRAWEKMLKMLSWDFGRWKKSNKLWFNTSLCLS